MILARAFPHQDPDSRMQYIDCIFDTPDSLDRLCNISGGHVRNLLGLIFRCLQREDPPFSRETIELLIEERRNDLILALSPHDWELLRQVHETKNISSEATYQTLLRSMFVFEYRHADAGRWFDINPILIEAKAFKQGNFGSRSLSFG
jgi:hypothetical protein